MCLTLVRTGYLNVKSCYHYQNTSTSLGQRKLGRNVPVGADVKKSLNFDCPEEFGYYPHPADCTQYYVCVFGGALLESCTGGLMYSHELQTCDWPRNVGCDGTGDVVTTPSVAYVSSTPSRSADSKIRYSHPPPPPPIPPQPAAVVTSRGQPRQLQHSQQELIKQKQQQQLYVDADDTLSPAEEIESDRQQRVYRGQPSTVGQVQRDRDGLRQHTNAIPLSSGRGEKISIISFSGQQQQQPIQQYSETDDDDHLTNSLTTIIHNRYKRQLGRSQNYAGGSIHVIAAQAFPNGQPSASPSFQSYLAPYRTDITNSRDRSVEILPSTLANNNYQRITLSNLRSNNYDQNYQYYHLHHHNIPQLPDAKPVNHKAQLTLNYNTNGFVPSLHFPILGKQPRAPDLDTFTQTRGSIALFRKPTTTEFIPISKRPDSIYKQYLTVNTDRPKNISALYTPNNNSFNILSFIDYLKQPLSGHLISIPQYSGTNLTKNTNPKIEIYADSPVTKITSGTSHLKQVLALTNNPTKFNTNEDFRETIRPSTSSKMLAQNYSYYDEYYDYPNETEYYDDDLNLLTLNRSYPLKNSSVTTTTPLPKITKVKPPLAKLHNTQRNTGSSTTITSPFARISTTVRQTTESGHRLSTTHRIENKGNRAIEQTLSTVPPKTIYNNSNNYDSSRYDSYYALYDDDVDIYKDVEYAQHYNNEPTPKQVYRGTPATVTHEVIQQEKSPKISNSGYIQNTYSASDDIYQPADVQSYSDDVSYGTQDDERTVYHQTSKQTNRYPNTANQNEVRVQPTLYTLPGSPGSKHTPSIQKPTFPLLRTTPDASVQRPIIKQPSPFSFANHVTTPKTLFFHYITKTSMSTSIVSTTPTSSTPENYNKSQLNTTSSKIIIPTTYSPPFFFLKSRLNSHSGETVKKNNSWNSTDKSVPSFSNSSAHLEVNATSINNELWSSTNVATEENDEETATVPVAPAFQPQNNLNDKIISSSTESFKRTVYVPTTTTTTEFEPQEVSTSESVALDNDITNTSWLLLLERLNSITTENKTESTPISESENNQTSSYSFKSNLEKQLPFTSIPPVEVTKKLSSSRNTSLPARVSRVNTAIKSVIAFGGTPRQYKCSDSPNVTCGKINQRVTNNRGRGSAHYTTSGRNDNSVNRGTPPSRSRPTLKPSTSVVAKAAEFIDIYKYPPRRPEPIYPQPLPDKTAAKCRKDVCLLPDCSCGGKEIPGDLDVADVPQMVLLTFDDAVNDLNLPHYSELFENGRVNPNGCPIVATFYVSHEWTDYSQVQNLYADGHELASHTVSHSFGEQFSQKKWTKEVAGQREILSAYGGVHLEDVRGMRAPFLSVGGNKMFKMLYDSNFTFDSSMPIYENKPPSWPYTLDYKLFHDCMIPPCPTRSYPGVWEVPMVMWQDLNGGRCSMGDACSNPSDAEGVYKMIMKNFERHYTSNRAPFGLFYHAAWFTQPHHKEGFIQFLDAINSMKDVWLVTNWQAIQWVRDPTPTSRLNSFQPFGCNYPDRPKRCNNPKVCNLWHKTGVRYMRTCQPCPDIYPWTGNTGIHSSRIDNDLEE
ncbi:uncharacterized protein LOC116166626 isoform X2 [Photinus pyralis]|nr:uncharacterized protein LOC116166626 isoform X2 [Photinus pyralis]